MTDDPADPNLVEYVIEKLLGNEYFLSQGFIVKQRGRTFYHLIKVDKPTKQPAYVNLPTMCGINVVFDNYDHIKLEVEHFNNGWNVIERRVCNRCLKLILENPGRYGMEAKKVNNNYIIKSMHK